MEENTYEISNFSLDNDSLLLGETLFHNANGYIGVRANFEEGYPDGYKSVRGMYINGFYDFAEMKQAEKLYGLVEEKQTMLNVADTQGIKLTVGGEEFSLFEGTLLESSRWLDMSRGFTGRRVVWKSPEGKEVEIVIKRMTSFTRLSIFTIDYQVTLKNCDAKISFRSSHQGDVLNYFDPDDPRVAGESFQHITVKEVEIKDGCSYHHLADREISTIRLQRGQERPHRKVGRVPGGRQHRSHRHFLRGCGCGRNHTADQIHRYRRLNPAR